MLGPLVAGEAVLGRAPAVLQRVRLPRAIRGVEGPRRGRGEAVGLAGDVRLAGRVVLAGGLARAELRPSITIMQRAVVVGPEPVDGGVRGGPGGRREVRR